MSITIRTTNRTRQAEIQIKNMSKQTKKSVKTAFFSIGKDLKQTAIDDIKSKPKHGRIYRIKINGRRVLHVASRAGSSGEGEAPANMTGKLISTIDYNIPSSTEMYFGAGDDRTPYARYLELGTRRMEKRQYLIKAINSNARNICTKIQNQILKDLGNES